MDGNLCHIFFEPFPDDQRIEVIKIFHLSVIHTPWRAEILTISSSSDYKNLHYHKMDYG